MKSKYTIPKRIFGVDVEGAMERALQEQNANPITQQPQNNNLALNDFIILNNPVLGYNWFDTHKELHKQGLRMLVPIEFLQLLDLAGEKDKLLYERITKLGDYRGEWIDADFKVINNQLCVNTYHEPDSNGNLIIGHSEILQPCLMQDKLPGIDLEYWINNHTKQGFPLENTPDGSLYYWYPRSDNNSVARFNAGSGGAGFDCDGGPSISDASLGVRFARSASR